MVFFTCNACGESLKKGQVEKHVNMCRNCQCLSCMDCGKDFWGDDYKHHVKCLSEDQKYGGKNYEAKMHKGDVKQQEWIQNWMTNSLKIHNTTLQDQVWDIFSEATRKETLETQSVKNEIMPAVSEDNTIKTEKQREEKSKKESKEKKSIRNSKEIKLKAQQESLECLKSEKSRSDILEEDSMKMPQSYCLKMAKQREAVGPAKLQVNGNGPETGAKARVRKRKNSFTKDAHESPIPPKIMNYSEIEENQDKHQGKFNWKGTISAVLKQAPDNEISIKKLRKKVIAQYYAVTDNQHKSEEETLALFNKKITSNPKFRVLKEKVKLLK
ncbi:cell growth-regulating nucleolar protein isoform X2 [Candoia aspera]|uniref:cell growth-regulating nucleolar protein isoform X2 n=1 Tax=Candoia aspera TaxID=51853 RepID=UPI002FD85633